MKTLLILLMTTFAFAQTPGDEKLFKEIGLAISANPEKFQKICQQIDGLKLDFNELPALLFIAGASFKTASQYVLNLDFLESFVQSLEKDAANADPTLPLATSVVKKFGYNTAKYKIDFAKRKIVPLDEKTELSKDLPFLSKNGQIDLKALNALVEEAMEKL